MTSLVEKLDALQISDEKSRKDMFGYIYRTKKGKQYFLWLDDHMEIIPSFVEKKFIICKLVRDKDNIFICFLCDTWTVLDKISQQSKKTSSFQNPTRPQLSQKLTCSFSTKFTAQLSKISSLLSDFVTAWAILNIKC